MKETDLYQLAKANIGGEFTRLENLVGIGVFDMYLAKIGVGNWIENKIRHGNYIKVRGSQFIWGRAQLRAGMENLWFLVGTTPKDAPNLYYAEDIFLHCNPNITDKNGHMLVDLRSVSAYAVTWNEIRRALA